MKKLLLILCIIVLSLFSLFCIFVISGAFAILIPPPPPSPQIIYGEFPFSITYEIDNEIVTYKDVVICEYEGIENLGTGGKQRKWSQKLKSGNEYIVLLQYQTNDSHFEIYAPIPGLPEYYMGDFRKNRSEYESIMKDDRYLGYKQDNIDCSITKEEAWEHYRIKIINIECSLPIENNFK